MELQSFQPWQRRNASNQIIRNGSYGKETDLVNANNNGILDYIGNNLDVLNDGKLNVSGGTMTGELRVNYSGNINIYLKNTNSGNISTSAPSSDYYSGVQMFDNENKTLGCVSSVNSTTGIETHLMAQNRSHNAQAYIRIGYDNNGNVFTSAPTPATTDSSSKIATTAYVRNSSVSKSGDTMTGALYVPTADVTSNNTQAATTSFVKNASVRRYDIAYNTEYSKPWKAIASAFADMPKGICLCGAINNGAGYYYYGARTSGNYASFIVHSYYLGQVWHVYMNNGTWYYQTITCSSATSFEL